MIGGEGGGGDQGLFKAKRSRRWTLGAKRRTGRRTGFSWAQEDGAWSSAREWGYSNEGEDETWWSHGVRMVFEWCSYFY